MFGQVKEWDMLKLREVIGVSLLVACPIAFNLLRDLSQQTDMLKLMKNAQL